MDVRVDRSPAVSGVARVPGSKSHTNRALVAAALASGQGVVRDGLLADDADSMVDGLRALGIAVDELDEASWRVYGRSGVLPAAHAVVDANLAGTTFRFLSAVAVLTKGEVTVTGRPPLLARPVGPLVRALRACGADVAGSDDDGDRAPLVIRRRTRSLGGGVDVDASASSQFVSALLLVSPYFERGLVLRQRGLSARGFVDMTIDVMRRRGVDVEVDDDAYRVRGGQVYAAIDETVPGDASAASHLFTLAVAAAGSITVSNMGGAQAQPDAAVLDVFAAFGATVERGDSVIVARDARTPLAPVDVDLSTMPDQLPNVAVLAALAGGASTIRGVGVTRFHETDRIAAVTTELGKAGVRVDVSDDGDAVVVHGGTARTPSAPLETYHDHRLAMAFAALAAAVGGATILGADCVAKTYRAFWDDAAALGLRWAPSHVT